MEHITYLKFKKNCNEYNKILMKNLQAYKL